MAVLTIPKEYAEGLSLLSGLSDEAFESLASELDHAATFALNPRTVANNIASKIATIPKNHILRIVDMLVSMDIVRDGVDVSKSEFVDDVFDAIKRSENPKVKALAEGPDVFKPRLSRLLDAKSLDVVSKAQSVVLDHERRFCSARISTDISPVFSENAEEPPLAAAITHTLRVSFHLDSNEIKEFFVQLDGDDLDDLAESIIRAQQKAESLKGVLKAAQLPLVE